MTDFFIPPKKKEEKFVQEYLYIEAPVPVEKPKEQQIEKEERGVVIIELF